MLASSLRARIRAIPPRRHQIHQSVLFGDQARYRLGCLFQKTDKVLTFLLRRIFASVNHFRGKPPT